MTNPSPDNLKKAVVLFNLGGPSHLDEVEGFLFKLFSDKAIIDLPFIFRWLLAKFISKKRTKYAQNIYKKIGGSSPILKETIAQKNALENALKSEGNYKVFVAMNYSSPNIKETVQDVQKFAPDEVILLPLYPQFSTTTTQSSFREWDKHKSILGKGVVHKKICCYPEESSFINAHAKLILKEINKLKSKGFRVLFSAHGIPQKTVDKGDPYEQQVKKTTESVLKILEETIGNTIDYRVTYQSKVGRLKWLEPSTETEIIRAGKENKNLIISPIAFVSEHSETLVELDMDYKELAEKSGVKKYLRVPTLSCHEFYIKSLKYLCLKGEHDFYCGKEFSQCCKNRGEI